MKVQMNFKRATKRTFVFESAQPMSGIDTLYISQHVFITGHEAPQPPAVIIVTVEPVGTAVGAVDPLAGV